MLVGKARSIPQNDLTSECWYIQMNGKDACITCIFRDKPELCGGEEIRKTGKNRKGKEVPLGVAIS